MSMVSSTLSSSYQPHGCSESTLSGLAWCHCFNAVVCPCTVLLKNTQCTFPFCIRHSIMQMVNRPLPSADLYHLQLAIPIAHAGEIMNVTGGMEMG